MAEGVAVGQRPVEETLNIVVQPGAHVSVFDFIQLFLRRMARECCPAGSISTEQIAQPEGSTDTAPRYRLTVRNITREQRAALIWLLLIKEYVLDDADVPLDVQTKVALMAQKTLPDPAEMAQTANILTYNSLPTT